MVDPNFGTMLVILILLAILYLAAYSIYSDKKKGKSSCGNSCSHCGASCSCHNIKKHFENLKSLS